MCNSIGFYVSFRNEPSPSSKHPLAQLDARQIYTSPEERRHNIINEAGDTRLCVIRDSDYTYQPQRIVCRGAGRTDKDSVKKVECPRPPTDPSTHHLLTCRGHVYETTFQPDQPVVTTLPLPVYHDLEQEVEEQRNRSSCWWIQWLWMKFLSLHLYTLLRSQQIPTFSYYERKTAHYRHS